MFLVTKDTTTTFSPSKLKATRQSSEVPSFLPIWYIKSLLSLRGMIFPPNESFSGASERASERASKPVDLLSVLVGGSAGLLPPLSFVRSGVRRPRPHRFLPLSLSFPDRPRDHCDQKTFRDSFLLDFFGFRIPSCNQDRWTDGRTVAVGRTDVECTCACSCGRGRRRRSPCQVTVELLGIVMACVSRRRRFCFRWRKMSPARTTDDRKSKVGFVTAEIWNPIRYFSILWRTGAGAGP